MSLTKEEVTYIETQRNAPDGSLGFWEFRIACYWQAPSLEAVKVVAHSLVDGRASNVWHAVSLYTGSTCMCVPCRKLRNEVA